jgi:hypothetical protein
MARFLNRGVRKHSRHYVERFEQVNVSQGVLLDRHNSRLVQYAG